MKSKKGFALSLEVLIVMILAIVTLVIMLGFITGFIPDLMDKIKGFPTLEMEPSPKYPISFIPSTISRGHKNKMSIGFYNTEGRDIIDTVVPEINCVGISDVSVKAAGLNIPVGEWKRYSTLVSVPKETKPDHYSCIMKISETDKTFFMEVN